MCDPITSVEEDRDGDGDTFWNDDTDKDEKAQNSQIEISRESP